MKKKTVLITGGAKGIGRACVEQFKQNGYSVAFIYKTSYDMAAKLINETGALGIRADVSDSYSINNAVIEIQNKLGDIDVLVNNAGVAAFSLFDKITDEEWSRIVGTNLNGAFYVSRAVVPMMIKNKYGRIINIGSIWGKNGASCEVHYSASKAGLRGLTMGLAKELGPSGITVNCIEPGVIDTDMNSNLTREALSDLVNMTPMGRLGLTNDIANAVLFFASDKASFITGQCIAVDGGFGI